MTRKRALLVILDVEGVLTLPGGGQHPWPLPDVMAVREFLHQAPLGCILCTGRQAAYGEAVIQALDLFRPLPPGIRERVKDRGGHDFLAWPSVLENGCYFYDPLAKRAIPHPALTPERTAVLHRLKAEVIAPLVERTGAQLEAGKDFCISLNPPLVRGTTDRQPIAPFFEEVTSAVSGYLDAVEIKHSASAVDITPHGVSKASAVSLLLDWTGLKPEEVLGVGDTKGDEEWLKVVGWRAAPANGREALPGMDYYSPYEVARGLLDILERLRDHGYAGL